MKHRNDQTVCVAYPYATGMSSRFHHSLLFLLMADAHSRQRVTKFGFNSSGANITNARNEIVEGFLKDDADYLWFVDTDMVFDPDVLERLVAVAHPVDRPIVGALCFSLQKGMNARPTIYTVRDDGKIGVRWDYPPDKVLEVDATGTGCLLIHRSVFEKMRGVHGDAYPYFQEASLGSLPVGEDITFCIRARALGFPIYVDTSVKVGHEKTFVVDESVYLAQRQARFVEPPQVPTYVVIASKNRRVELSELVASIKEAAEVIVYDNGYAPPLDIGAAMVMAANGQPLHRMWNDGLRVAQAAAEHRGHKAWNVAVLNDDLRIEPDFLSLLDRGLRSDDNIWIAYPDFRGALKPGEVGQFDNPQLAGQTMSGYAFMLRGETGFRFDEQFEWWYGDSDLERTVRDQGKFVVAVGGCHVEHLHPMESTKDPVRLEQARSDEKKYAAKYGLNPDDLWLAQHPEFGQ